jgi:predicted ester cyclase
MSNLANEALVRRHVAWQDYADPAAAMDDIWAERIAYHGKELGQLTTRQQLKEMIRGFMKAMPDLHAEVVSILSNDEFVFARVKITGTARGDNPTVVSTGEKMEFYVMDAWRIRDARIVESWVIEGLAETRDPEWARLPGGL